MLQEYAWDKSAPGGIGGLLVAKTSSDIYTYVYNHLGHVQKVLNASGQVVESYQYTPYGQVEGGDFSQQPFGYSTKRSDFASGLVYFGYRFYSPYQRRWLNRDPLQEQGGINLYAYVNGDPLGYVDPDGRNAIFAFAIGAGVDYVVQGAKYYRNTGEWISWDCVDKTDLLWSGLFSVVGPSGISSLKKIFKGLVHGTAAGKNVAKSHLKLQATWQGSKYIHKSASNIGGSPCGCN